jgi:hypothetical protein
MNNINSEEVRVNVQTNHNASVGNNAYEGGAVGNNAPDVDDNVLNSRPGRTSVPPYLTTRMLKTMFLRQGLDVPSVLKPIILNPS